MGGSVDSWLSSLGLEQYCDVFRENDVGLRALPHVTEDDLKELGVSLGHRRILLSAIAEFASAGPGHDTEAGDAGIVREPYEERRHLTAFFADLAGYTEMTNRFGPEEMRRLLPLYQDTLAGGITRFGGNIAKYLGDGLLVYFGWPVAYEDHPYRAVSAGLEALRAIRDIKAPDGRGLSARIGIASGPVVVGDLIGQNTREESAVTGRILNLAARIQAVAPPNGLVIPAEMQALLGDVFEYEDRGRFDIKGFSEPQRVLQVIREKKAESRFRATHRGHHGAIVGREHERGLMAQAWSRACAGSGGALILTGEAGIGKSRLAEDFLDQQVPFEGTDVIRLNCSPYFSSAPFHPVAERITSDADLLPGDGPEDATAKLRRLLERRNTPELDSVLPVYAALTAPQAEAAKPVTSLPPQEQNDLIIQTLSEVLRRRAGNQPLLLVVEDAHWIDPSTAKLLDRIVATCSDMRVMVLLTHRPEWESGWAGQYSNVTTVQLPRLSSGQAAELITRISGQRPGKDVTDSIIARTDGVPLYLEEVARAAFTGGPAAAEVPSSLQGAMMARLDNVSEEAKQTALTASVFGREFYPDLVAAAMGQPETAVRGSLEELCRPGLVYESGQRRGAYVFKHALLRDTAYQSMVSATRRTRHEKAAAALLSLRPGWIDREPELAARHFTEAGDHHKAHRYWCAAAEKSLARSASEEAMANSEAALAAAEQLGEAAATERLTAAILYGRSCESIGRLSEAVDHLFAAADTARKAGLQELFTEAAYRVAGAALMTSQKVEAAYSACRAALASLPEGDEETRCRLLGQLARCTMHMGLFAESADLSREALELASRLGDKRAQFAVMMSRFFAPLIARQAKEVKNWRGELDSMQTVADSLGDTDQGRERSISFYVAAEMGDRERAQQSLERLSDLGRRRNYPHLHWVEQHGHAMMAILDGDFPAAEAYANSALSIGRKTHGAHIEGVFGVQMFTIRREQARLGEVAPVVKKLLRGNPDDMAWKPGFGVIAAELGHADAARRILSEVAETGFDLPLDSLYSTTLAYLAEICAMVGSSQLAEQIYALLLPYRSITITAGVTTVCNGAAGRRLGALAALLGDWDRSEEHFETALEVDARMRARPWLAHTQAAYARALRSRGRPEDARQACILEVEALETAGNLGMISLASSLRGQMH
ncbi:ATP-binding protein (plasmid) [Roseobacteraceae bacterium NS-SX3]